MRETEREAVRQAGRTFYAFASMLNVYATADQYPARPARGKGKEGKGGQGGAGRDVGEGLWFLSDAEG